MTTVFYKCMNCNHENDELDEIDIVDWANVQDPADVVGIPSGCCTECGAPVYEPGTFDKIDAARAMLAALCRCMDEANLGSTTHAAAAEAITQARAAGITPTP
jgi:hypothetical protein